MYLDFKKISEADADSPLRLRTLDGRELGPIPFVHNQTYQINYTGLSEMSFRVPRMAGGLLNPLYDAVAGCKVVYTENLGIYVLQAPKRDGDGMAEVKTVTGYSLEYLFSWKTLFLEEGTYNFWDPVDPSGTVLGRILELDPSWRAGYITPRLVGCWRTFDQYNRSALDFCYGDAMEKYRCVIVFDTYAKTVSAYDSGEDTGTLPIYLSFNNLLSEVSVEEVDEELVTKLRPYGTDNLSVRAVNPAGTDWLVELGYFLQNGDLDVMVDGSLLADRVRDWSSQVELNRAYYAALVASRSSMMAQRLAAQADLADRQGELDTLTAKQSVTIQAYALEKNDAGRAKRQVELDQLNREISEKKAEIQAQERNIVLLQGEEDSFAAEAEKIVRRVGYEAFFTERERKVLCPYLIEGELSEDTFVAADVNLNVSGTVSKLSGAVEVSDASVSGVYLEQFKKTVLTAEGGSIRLPEAGIEGAVVRAVLDLKDVGGYVLTVSLGSLTYGGHRFPRGMLTINGTASDFQWDVKKTSDHGVEEMNGTRFSFETADAGSYFTVGMTPFDEYAVAMELYDFGRDYLKDTAWPTYEFSVSSANFLYHKKFEPFKNALELGKSVRIDLGSDGVLKAKIIGIELDMEDISSFSLTFSNRYKLRNQLEALRSELASASRATRSFDAGKYIYNRTADKTTQVGKYLDDLKKGAAEAVLASKNQSVVVGGSGIHIGGDSAYQLRLTDSMIAMTDNGWQTAKVGIGRFASPTAGEVWGLNAELLAGNLIIGKNMVLENPLLDENNQPTGTMMFKVDATGAWLYNSRIIMQNEGGVIAIDPDYGVVAGTKLLFDSNGTTITPEFMDAAGELAFDKDGMPVNANFFLDGKTGDAYFRGKIYATDGVFNGTVYAKDGEFTGKLKAAILEGDLLSDKDKGGWIRGPGISVGGNYEHGMGNFYVDQDGNLTLNGNINLSGGNITWGKNSPTKYQFSTSLSGPWHDTMAANDKYRRDSTDGGTTWGSPYQFVGTDGKNGADGSDASVPSYIKRTYIDSARIESPTIVGGTIRGSEFIADNDGGVSFVSSNGTSTFGTITYGNISGTDYGLILGAADSIYLDANQGAIQMRDQYGISWIASRAWVESKLGSVTAVFA